MRALRKALAGTILITFAGLVVEAEIPGGDWRRAPLTGVTLAVGAGLVMWAAHELEPRDEHPASR